MWGAPWSVCGELHCNFTPIYFPRIPWSATQSQVTYVGRNWVLNRWVELSIYLFYITYLWVFGSFLQHPCVICSVAVYHCEGHLTKYQFAHRKFVTPAYMPFSRRSWPVLFPSLPLQQRHVPSSTARERLHLVVCGRVSELDHLDYGSTSTT
jgi:hypothetical protein